MKIVNILLALLVFTGVSASNLLAQENEAVSVPTKGGNWQRTGEMPTAAFDFDNLEQVGTIWSNSYRNNRSRGQPGSATVAGDMVIFGTDGGSVNALHIPTGTHLWSKGIGTGSPATVTVHNGLVYTGSSTQAAFHALDITTGEEVWNFPIFHGFTSTAVVADDVVVVGADDGIVYAFDAVSGEVRWRLGTGSPVTSSPAYADGVVFVHSESADLYAVDAVSGEQMWKFTTAYPVSEMVTVANGVVYVSAVEHNASRQREPHGSLEAIDVTSGELLWSYEDPGNATTLTPVAVSQGLVYTAEIMTGFPVALDAATGEVVWIGERESYYAGAPVVAGDVVFFSSPDRFDIQLLNRETGELVFRIAEDVPYAGPVTVADEMVFIGNGYGAFSLMSNLRIRKVAEDTELRSEASEDADGLGEVAEDADLVLMSLEAIYVDGRPWGEFQVDGERRGWIPLDAVTLEHREG